MASWVEVHRAMQKSKSGVFGSTLMAGLSMLHSVSWYFLNKGEKIIINEKKREKRYYHLAKK